MRIPPAGIRILDAGVVNTVDEVKLLARELQRVGGDRVLLVTSKPHGRRVRATWRAFGGDLPQVIVRYASEDSYDADHRWRRTRDALAVSREVFGLLNVRTGFPVRPERR
jgi:uncharacterized SAM-binding protein YcdF (DUF218 family)